MTWPGFLEGSGGGVDREQTKSSKEKKSKKLIKQENVSQLGGNLLLQK